MISKFKCPFCDSAIDYEIKSNAKFVDELIEEDLIVCNSCGCLLEVTTDIKITVVRR